MRHATPTLLCTAALGAVLLAGPASACPDLPGYRCGSPTPTPHGHEIREDRWERNGERRQMRHEFRDERREDRWERKERQQHESQDERRGRNRR